MYCDEDGDWPTLQSFPWVAGQAESVFILQQFDPKFKTVPGTIQWLTVLGGLATEGAFWWYRQNPRKDEEGRSPPMPWLFTHHDPSERQCNQLIPHDPFFIDDNDRYSRLAEASKIEKHTQYQLVANVFNPSRRHRAWYTPAQTATLQGSFFVHIKLQAEPGETEVNVPQLAEMTEVQFEEAEEGRTYLKTDLNQKEVVVETHRPGDLVLLVKGAIPQHGGEVEIVTLVKPNTMPIDEQIKALRNVSLCSSWGELEGTKNQGFSLGVELDPASGFYFLLDARKMSEVPLQQQDERIAYILENFPLDEAQHQAFLKSTFKVTCGINLIQGPPGTGKTRTAMVIILLLMALDLKVLLVAGSNKGVDNLAEAVVVALNKYPQLRQWCGQFIRFRTPSYQLAQVRIDSVNANQAGLGVLRRGSSASQILEQVQIHNVVQPFANEYAELTSHCEDFLDMVRKDKECHLSKDQSKKLRDSYESCALGVLAKCNVVATTLNNASHQLLRNSDFKPDVVISDEAGQCLEGEHCIALTMSSVKAVVLIGDPDQVPPTVMSENDCNEGAKYLKRSLMARLHKAGYPCTMLNTNYRNHSAILDFWNQKVYGGALQVGRSNDAPDRVGNAWDAFTSSRHYFRGYGVAGLRRLFISTDGHADRHQNSLSSYNRPQVEVLRHLLSQLYQFETPQGDKIEPKDVMIISPYRDQRTLVDEVLGRHNIGFNENVTVDAAQGSESPVVVFLMTKPSANALDVGFVGNRNRLNVALSRAQKVEIIIGNLRT
jgi:ATP-dependent RNA/DNA helicase IGHMBP2